MIPKDKIKEILDKAAQVYEAFLNPEERNSKYKEAILAYRDCAGRFTKKYAHDYIHNKILFLLLEVINEKNFTQDKEQFLAQAEKILDLAHVYIAAYTVKEIAGIGKNPKVVCEELKSYVADRDTKLFELGKIRIVLKYKKNQASKKALTTKTEILKNLKEINNLLQNNKEKEAQLSSFDPNDSLAEQINHIWEQVQKVGEKAAESNEIMITTELEKNDPLQSLFRISCELKNFLNQSKIDPTDEEWVKEYVDEIKKILNFFELKPTQKTCLKDFAECMHRAPARETYLKSQKKFDRLSQALQEYAEIRNKFLQRYRYRKSICSSALTSLEAHRNLDPNKVIEISPLDPFHVAVKQFLNEFAKIINVNSDDWKELKEKMQFEFVTIFSKSHEKNEDEIKELIDEVFDELIFSSLEKLKEYDNRPLEKFISSLNQNEHKAVKVKITDSNPDLDSQLGVNKAPEVKHADREKMEGISDVVNGDLEEMEPTDAHLIADSHPNTQLIAKSRLDSLFEIAFNILNAYQCVRKEFNQDDESKEYKLAKNLYITYRQESLSQLSNDLNNDQIKKFRSLISDFESKLYKETLEGIAGELKNEIYCIYYDENGDNMTGRIDVIKFSHFKILTQILYHAVKYVEARFKAKELEGNPQQVHFQNFMNDDASVYYELYKAEVSNLLHDCVKILPEDKVWEEIEEVWEKLKAEITTAFMTLILEVGNRQDLDPAQKKDQLHVQINRIFKKLEYEAKNLEPLR